MDVCLLNKTNLKKYTLEMSTCIYDECSVLILPILYLHAHMYGLHYYNGCPSRTYLLHTITSSGQVKSICDYLNITV